MTVVRTSGHGMVCLITFVATAGVTKGSRIALLNGEQVSFSLLVK